MDLTGLLLILFGFSWSITDSAILIGYGLLLIFFFISKNWKKLFFDKISLYTMSFVVWRTFTGIINKSITFKILLKNIKFLFDVSPVFVFRNPSFILKYKYLIYSFLISLAILTIASAIVLFGIRTFGFFEGDMLKVFHRNHLKSGFIWSLGSLLALIFGIKYDRKLLIIAPILVVGLFYTQARSYYLGFAGAILWVFALMGFKHSVKYLLSGVSLLLFTLPVGYFIAPIKERFLSIFLGLQTDGSIKCRLIFWEEGLKVFKSSPIWGIGFGQWSSFFSSVNSVYKYPCPNYHAHNIFIHELVESGIVGLLLLSLLLVYLLFVLTRSYLYINASQDNARYSEAILLSGVAAVLNFIIGGFFEPALVKSVVLIPTFTVVGFALAESDKLKSSP